MEEKSIYDEKGKIKEPNVAHDVAKLEDKAITKEQQLQKEAQTGLTEKQRANKEIMEGLTLKYPDAFQEKVDDKGRQVLIMPPVIDARDTSVFFQTRPTILTQEGFIHLSIHEALGGIEEINYTNLIDHLQERGDKFGEMGSNMGWEGLEKDKIFSPKDRPMSLDYPLVVAGRLVELNDDRGRECFKNALQRSQEVGIKRKRKSKIEAAKLTPQAILDDL